MEEKIKIEGARVHNLKNIDLEIPRNALVVITGLSGSGKSSLAFDTIYAEGQRRYMETLSMYARQYIGTMERPDVDKISGLSPVVAIEQKIPVKGTIFLLTELLAQKVLSKEQACDFLVRMRQVGSRLPWDEARKQICIASKS